MAAEPPNCGDYEGINIMQDNKKITQNTTRLSRRAGRAARTPAALTGLFLAGLSLTGLSLAGFAQAAPAAPKTDTAISQALAAPAKTGWIGVIVRTSAPLTAAQEAQMTALGADIVRRLPIIGSVAVRVPQRSLAKLAALPFAVHLSLDGAVQKTDEFTVASSEASQAYSAITPLAPPPPPTAPAPPPPPAGATAPAPAPKPAPALVPAPAPAPAPKISPTVKLTGSGITVAVLDSGITPVADLSSQANDLLNQAPSRLIGSVNFSTPLSYTTGKGGKAVSGLPLGVNSSNLYDPCGHGSHVAGIIAGNGSRSQLTSCTHTFLGIAPQANLVSVRVLDANGGSTVSTVIAGLQWVVQHQNDNKAAPIRVVNLSLGHPVSESCTTDPICQAVEAVYQAGMVVVCAAGNEGRVNGTVNTPGLDNEGWGTAYGSIQSPGNDPYVITVGATKNMDGIRKDDRIATYSSRGPSRLDLVMKPDIVAPGNKVISLDANGSTLDNYAGGTNDIAYSYYVQSWAMSTFSLSGASADYFQLSGTSMASPVVAGAAALLLQANPNLSPDTVKARLLLSADKWTAPDGTQDPLTYGAGYLNIPAALASAAVAQGPSASPALTLNADGSVTVDLSRAMWGSSLWGTGVTDLRAMWGSRAMWGCTSVDMTRVMWGRNTTFSASSAVAASSAPSASRAMWGSSVWGDRAQWGSSCAEVDLTSTALSGE